MDPYLEEPSQWPGVHLLRVGENTVACPKEKLPVPDRYSGFQISVWQSGPTVVLMQLRAQPMLHAACRGNTWLGSDAHGDRQTRPGYGKRAATAKSKCHHNRRSSGTLSGM